MKAIRLIEDIVANDGAPVILKGSIGVYSPDESKVFFTGAVTAGGSPVFSASFVDSVRHKVEDLPVEEVPPEMENLDFSGHIPILGWGLQ